MESATMTGSSTVHRRQPLLRKTPTTLPRTFAMKHCETLRKRKGEVAGRTAAECTMVCCCLPCAVIHFLILAVYKVPKGLCQKMLRKNKQKMLLNNNNKKKSELKCGSNGASESENVDLIGGTNGGKTAAKESETEMWDQFYGGGFWRNASLKKQGLKEDKKNN